jgi:Hydrazine synthase alpha subunit middle domain/FG-GAP-like repeat
LVISSSAFTKIFGEEFMQTSKACITWLNWRATHRLIHRVFTSLVAIGISAITLSVFAAPHDLSADSKSDLIFGNASTGQISGWLMNGSAPATQAGLVAPGNWTVSHIADFNADGKADLLFRHDNGSVTLWLMNGVNMVSSVGLLGTDPDWRVSHVGDFNGDGKADILWRHTNGAVTMWLMDGINVTSRVGLLGPDPLWSVSHVGDFNGDGKADILWRNTNGAVTSWLMNGSSVTTANGLLGPDADWRVSHVADFNGDGKADLLWRHTNGAVTTWLMNGGSVANAAGLLGPDANWSVTHTGDFNGDGKADLLWRNTNGAVTQWLMNGTALAASAGLLGADANWRVTHLGDYNGDGKADLLWRNTNDGAITMWLLNGATVTERTGILGASDWRILPTVTPTISAAGPIANPILFAAQVPTLNDFASRASTFGNHRGALDSAVRGGDLMIRYPDGTLRNLTKEAGFGMDGMQGSNAIAVREPTVHWSGSKAIFSMVVGAATAQYQVRNYYWQLYEVTGLAKGQTASITKVANQPAAYNNISPLYASDDRVLFTSDRARNGAAHLYPQLDEYESTATVTGIWSLNPSTGDLKILNHTPSGAFSPTIDSYGRVVFTRWDHLQRDQQADAGTYGAFNFADESAGAAKLASQAEVFPETRDASTSAFGPVAGYTNNRFTPWQMNQDGTDEETLNHVGVQELGFGYNPKSFTADAALSDYTNDTFHVNKKSLRSDGGLYHIKEDPARAGIYYSIYAREFGSLSSNQIVKFNGGIGTNAEQMTVTDFTPADNSDGRYRNPLPLSDGKFVATHTQTTAADPNQLLDFRLKQLTPDANGRYQPGASLTGGINKTISWWDPDVKRNFSGLLWELEAVEVVARTRPTAPVTPLETPEKSVFTEEAVDETALRNWLKTNDLAMVVTRNQTSRDRADFMQPFNLQVPGGVKTVSPKGGRVYDISHYQILQADQIRGYNNYSSGRRSIAQPLHEPKATNPANPGGPAGSVKIAADGSTAAFVPARRALAWQTTDAAGNAVVRERVWVTFQPGEVRVCASCHGVNTKDQSGAPPPVNKPEALRDLLRFWKTLPK